MNIPPPTAKQARMIWLALTGLAIATLVGLVVATIWGAGQVLQILAPVLWPLAVAGVLAYLLDPVVDWLQGRGMSRKVSILSVFTLALLLLGLLFASVVPQLVTETRDLAERIPMYVQRAQTKVQQYLDNPPRWAETLLKKDTQPSPPVNATNGAAAGAETNVAAQPSQTTNAQTAAQTDPAVGSASTNSIAGLASRIDANTLQSAGSWAASALPKIGKWLLSQTGRVASWFGVLAALALIPVYTYFLLSEKRGIQTQWPRYLPVSDSKFKDEMVFVIGSANEYMIAFFRGQVLVAICDGIMYAIGFLIIGLPYAVLLGVMAVFLTLIPFLGAIIICTFALLLALVQYGDLLHPLLVLAVFGVVQGIEGFVVVPKILGDKVGLHPLTIIIAVMAGTTLLGGLLGGVLAIPLTALLRVLLSRYVWKRPVDQPGSSG